MKPKTIVCKNYNIFKYSNIYNLKKMIYDIN